MKIPTVDWDFAMGCGAWGFIDIQLGVTLMSQYQISPREEHLEALYLIFHFLWKNPK